MRDTSLDAHIKKHMKAPRSEKAWHELDTEFELMESMIKAREKGGSHTGRTRKENRDETAGIVKA